MNPNSGGREPWYAPGGSAGPARKSSLPQRVFEAVSTGKFSVASLFGPFASSLLSIVSGVAAGIAAQGAARNGLASAPGVALALGSAALVFLAFALCLRAIGSTLTRVSSKHVNTPPMSLALDVFKGQAVFEEGRKGVPAPEMALQQFVQQVRAYATEKSYQRNRGPGEAPAAGKTNSVDSADLLKRRWNEVLDSLSEFEVYLANDPRGMIEKFLAKYPSQVMDVSQVFRDVAESFDTTWRRKGINIEAAIVTPLRANTSEALLRRLLVGPWRASAYLARRGNGVIFSAKSGEGGKVVTRWECEGLTIPDDYLQYAQQSEIPVNERIERGMQVVASDPNSPNALHGLVSFITWIDLAKLAGSDFSFKHTNDGFVIEMRFH